MVKVPALISTMWFKIIMILVFFILLLLVNQKELFIPNGVDLMGISTFLFAIFTGFYIATTFTNYSKLQTLIAEETGKLITLSKTIKSTYPLLSKEVDNAIDNYLVASFDFELIQSVENTWKEFNQIIEVTNKIKNKKSNNFIRILEINSDLVRMRQEFDLAANRIMGYIDWMVLITLAVINILLLYSINSSTVISSIVTVLFSTTLIVVLLLLNSLDNNTFAEEKFSFYIYQRVFKEIGKLPYFPEVIIKSSRVKPPKETYRLGIYKNFPKSFDKKIEIIEIT